MILSKNPNSKEIKESIEEVNNELLNSYVARRNSNREEEKTIGSIKESLESFFKYAISKRKVYNRIGPLKTIGKTAKLHFKNSLKEMAEILSMQYKLVFTEPMPDKQVFTPHTFLGPQSPATYGTW